MKKQKQQKKQLKQPKPIIICPGSINQDLKLYAAVSKGAKTFLGNYSEDLGGKGCDTCCAIKNLTGKKSKKEQRKVFLVGAVGNDKLAEFALKKLKQKNIETRFIKKKKAKTGIVLEHVFQNGEITVGIEPGANRLLTKKDILKVKTTIKNSALVCGQIENPIECLVLSFEIAKKSGVPTLLDPSVIPTKKQQRKILFQKVLPNTDILAPDKYELFQLTKVRPKTKSDLIKAAKELLKTCKILCITLGSRGVYVSNRERYIILPAFNVKPVDGGGAGDVFRGIFGYKIIEYCEKYNFTIENIPFKYIVKAAQFANAGAAICISKKGTIESIPTKKQIERFLKKK